MHSSSDPLWKWDAAALAPAIRNGAVSCREAVGSTLERLEAVNPLINAVVHSLHEEALAEAGRADDAVRSGAVLGPLHGVPITVKINTDQRGHVTDNGVAALKDVIAQEDDPSVANLRGAGAIIVGRTNVPCFSMRWFTENALHGKTANPWSSAHTPGGSSGGAAAACAAGIGPIAHGNDIAGSIRYPAFCCGVAGLRPSTGRVPGYNPSVQLNQLISSQMMGVQGPLARRVRDLRLAFDVMAQPDIRDPRCMAIGPQAPPPRPLRAAIVADPGRLGVHATIADAIRQAGSTLERAGYIVEEVEPPELDYTASLWEKIAMPDVVARLEPLAERLGDEGIRRGLRYWRECWPERDPAACLAALGERWRLLRLWHAFFARYPVLVLPVSTQPPFEWDEDTRDAATTQRIIVAQRAMLAVSVLGLPGISVPTGLVDGLPIGVQIVAGLYREDLCFAAAEIIETQAPSMTPTDPRL